jgi:hypothetical protein
MKTTLNQETDANQVSTVLSADSHTTEAAGPDAASRKGRILALAHDQNLSGSFGAVLHLVALMDSGKPLVPNSEEERLSWAGYRRGHLSALLCLAMHERQCAPKDAALLVHSLLDKARAILRTVRPEGEA